MKNLLLGLVVCALVSCGAEVRNGVDGKNGADGRNGAMGADGKNGTDGSNGTNGMNGMPGAVGATKSLHFLPIEAALNDASKRQVMSASALVMDGTKHTMTYNTLLRSRQTVGANVFGRIIGKDGLPLKNVDNSEVVSPSNDFSSMLKAGSKLYEVTHFETVPAAMYLTELAQDAQGKLSAVSTRPIDFSSVEGLWIPCAGSVSPWGTHLGSEEYPADARVYENATNINQLGSGKQMLRYFGKDIYTDANTDGIPDLAIADARAVYDPYNYGFAVEVKVAEAGQTTVTKHYAMGRRALELAYVMPDKKTVYLTDDGSNDGFQMFIADTAGDLSAGKLYAARWFQTSPAGAANGAADLYWIELGHATNAEVKALITAKTRFSQIFDAQAPIAGGCDTTMGFKSVNTETGFECLRLKTGMEKAAAFLESRRYSAYLGATTEFRKTEGMTFDPVTSRLFVAFSETNQGMTDDPTGRDLGGPNHVRLARNDCGAVYELMIAPSSVLGSAYVAHQAKSFIEGTWLKAPGAMLYPADSPYSAAGSTNELGVAMANNNCSVNGIANPDNLTFIEGFHTLIIGEDTVDGHQNDVVWSYDLYTRELTRIASTPYGSETTGLYWYPDFNGFSYLKMQVQHPFGESDNEKASAASDKESYTGYLGPFPAVR